MKGREMNQEKEEEEGKEDESLRKGVTGSKGSEEQRADQEDLCTKRLLIYWDGLAVTRARDLGVRVAQEAPFPPLPLTPTTRN